MTKNRFRKYLMALKETKALEDEQFRGIVISKLLLSFVGELLSEGLCQGKKNE